MVLKNTRISITGIADNATEDAKAFTKAVKAEALRLLDITKAEESRLQELRDAFDAKVQSEKDAKIAAEWARIETIQNRINEIRRLPLMASGKPSIEVSRVVDVVREIACTEAEFDEFAHDAMAARSDAFNALESEFDVAVAREAAAAAAQKEREELAAAQAELKRQQAEQAAETQRQRDALAAEMKAEREKAEALRKLLEDDKRLFEQQERAKMAEQQAAMDARQRDLDHVEAIQMNAQFDQLAAARKLEAETVAAAEFEMEMVKAPVVETLQEQNLFADLVESKPMQGERAELHRPTDEEIIKLIAGHFNVKAEIAYGWLCELSHDIEYF
jgi:hypothetical protein